jgi:hypothetical protein
VQEPPRTDARFMQAGGMLSNWATVNRLVPNRDPRLGENARQLTPRAGNGTGNDDVLALDLIAAHVEVVHWDIARTHVGRYGLVE